MRHVCTADGAGLVATKRAPIEGLVAVVQQLNLVSIIFTYIDVRRGHLGQIGCQ